MSSQYENCIRLLKAMARERERHFELLEELAARLERLERSLTT